MIDLSDFYQIIAKNKLSPWLETLPSQLSLLQKQNMDSRFANWLDNIDLLPNMSPDVLILSDSVTAYNETSITDGEKKRIEYLLKSLSPWRKGPFSIYGIHIDAEWRSDWKWQRIAPYIDNLAGKMVLDVGCNNGYHLWRIIGAGAKLAVGIDPMPLFFCQFNAIRKLLGQDLRAHLVPVGIETMPALNAFDTVFSMGVLYHRRSPLDHIYQLKDQLIKGGQLILETLVIDGELHQALVPDDRYAKMRNVYFIPSVPTMVAWLSKCGFSNIKVVDVSKTSPHEQRKTDWITSESLVDFLDPKDHSKTVEGYPAPMRAVFIATK